MADQVKQERNKSASDDEFFDTEEKAVKSGSDKKLVTGIKMAASETRGFTLQVFDGTHYDKWKYKLKLFLEFKECNEVIENEEKPAIITEAKWKKKEIRAKNYIVNSMTNTQLE